MEEWPTLVVVAGLNRMELAAVLVLVEVRQEPLQLQAQLLHYLLLRVTVLTILGSVGSDVLEGVPQGVDSLFKEGSSSLLAIYILWSAPPTPLGKCYTEGLSPQSLFFLTPSDNLIFSWLSKAFISSSSSG